MGDITPIPLEAIVMTLHSLVSFKALNKVEEEI